MGLRTGLCVAALCLVASRAAAEPFTILSNGDLVFNGALRTSGVFVCSSVVPCTGSGTSTVTLGTGDMAITLSFEGVETTFQAGSVPTPVTIGRFHTASVSGGAVPFPAGRNRNVSILRFDLMLMQDAPAEATRMRSWGFGPGGALDLPLLTSFGRGNSVGLPTGPNPPGYNYTLLVYSFADWPFTIPGNNTYDVVANVSAVPEPATLVLLGAGLAGAACRRGRKTLADRWCRSGAAGGRRG